MSKYFYLYNRRKNILIKKQTNQTTVQAMTPAAPSDSAHSECGDAGPARHVATHRHESSLPDGRRLCRSPWPRVAAYALPLPRCLD